MDSCPLSKLRTSGDCTVETTPTGWFIPAAKGLTAVLTGSEDGVICRVSAGHDRELVQLGIGDATSRLCNAVFNPKRDEALVFSADGLRLTKNGTVRVACSGPLRVVVLRDYMKVHRNLPWFKAMDRRHFPKAPAGWCSWYFYYLAVNEEEVLRNTDWLAEHLRKFGCDWVQIDDGWQGRGTGYGSNRDWFVTCRKDFPKGMKFCAEYIRQKGFRPGIWLIPFTQSNPKLFESQPALFVHRADGSSPGERQAPLDYQWMPEDERRFEWAGRYFIDPTGAAGQAYLKKLFKMICEEWTYEYVKVDAQGGMAGTYGEHRARLQDESLDGERAYRKGLDAIKGVMGPGKFLLNCGAGWSSVGYCEGIRIGGDVQLNWTGVMTAADCTLQWLWLNTYAFYTDPDVVCVREPLPYPQARAWAVLLGLTGQLLMASDKMYELGEERVELLRRIFPVADIHPMEIYPLDVKSHPGVFDLKISLPGVGTWDVVACFNWSQTETKQVELTPERLGLEPGKHLWLDVFCGALLEPKEGKLTLEVPPASCQVVSVWPMASHPQFLGTSRHVTQGAVDVKAIAWDAKTLRLSGTSRVVGGDPYRVRVHVPDGYRVATEGVEQYGPLAVLTVQRPKSAQVKWEIKFKRK